MDILDLFCGDSVLQKSFWLSLCKVVSKYKSKLSSSIRDWLIHLFIKNLKKAEERYKLLEIFLGLLVEWTNFGNVIMPRDLLLSTCENAIQAVVGDDLSKSWLQDDFSAIKSSLERILKTVPESYVNSWKEKMGIDDQRHEAGVEKMEVDNEE